MEIEFKKRKRLRIIFYSIIINVSKINDAFDNVTNFAEKYDITGVTNGELLILYFMSYPEEIYENLISNVFEPNGFEFNVDFILIQEELSMGVQNHTSESLNQALTCLEHNTWLGSIINRKGNWVWKIS